MVCDNINQLRTLFNRIRADPSQSTNPLTMKLNGTIDAAVSGGVSNFEVGFSLNTTKNRGCSKCVYPDFPLPSLALQVFFTAEYQAQNPSCRPFVPKLQLLMGELVITSPR